MQTVQYWLYENCFDAALSSNLESWIDRWIVRITMKMNSLGFLLQNIQDLYLISKTAVLFRKDINSKCQFKKPYETAKSECGPGTKEKIRRAA